LGIMVRQWIFNLILYSYTNRYNRSVHLLCLKYWVPSTGKYKQ
jgi:hypothetical protein